MENWRDRAAIAGIGWTRFSKASGVSVLHLAVEACRNAIEDAGLTSRDIDGMACYEVGDSVPSVTVASNLGVPELRYSLDLRMGGPGGCMTVMAAAQAVALGTANYVVCYRAMNGRSGTRWGQAGPMEDYCGTEGQFMLPYGWVSAPQIIAMWCRRHMVKYGTTSQQLGAIAATCRQHASLNERAMKRTLITIDDYLDSPMIADPFRLLDICLETDGACAVVVTTAERAQALRHRPVYIMAAAQGAGPLASMSPWPNQWADHSECYARYIAPRLFAMAGITPKDIDVAEIYDCFTYSLLVQLEDFGFCSKGEGGAFVAEGRIGLGGELPVNTHGGLLSEGYIHGMNHIPEAVSQLRGDAGPRQVRDAEIALVTGYGASMGSALILRK
ncbi:MAG: acetyl-CoA acetyltransferase [Dehalococcoidia bacterium]